MKLVTVCALVAGLASAAIAQTTGTTNMEFLRQKIKADKKLLVARYPPSDADADIQIRT